MAGKTMRVNSFCAACLWDKQLHKSDDPAYLAEVRQIIDTRKDEDTAPYLVYLFNRAYERRFGKTEPYKRVKQKYNDVVLSMENEIRRKIESSSDPLAASIAYARIGNYIDFGAMNQIDGDTFLALLGDAGLRGRDLQTYEAFLLQCKNASRFLLIADNCGEIVLDKLFLEQLHTVFPKMALSVMVRGAEVLNDVTIEDAKYAGIDQLASLISNGSSVAGTIYGILQAEAKEAMDSADVILAKGQGNYESLCGQGRHIFYSLLCKCRLFTDRFEVPELTGVFIEET